MTSIPSALSLAEIGALIGDPARARMLQALMSGRALTAGELAFQAGVTPQTASGHLAKLADLGLLALEQQGRHRYFRLASAEIGRMLEGIQLVAALHAPPRHRPRSLADEKLRLARTCYDHLAGRLGVALADALTAGHHVELSAEGGEVTAAGGAFLAGLGLDLAAASGRRRAFCPPCLDWSERRPHLAGALGAALAGHFFQRRWIERDRDSRAVAITAAGRQALKESFGVEL